MAGMLSQGERRSRGGHVEIIKEEGEERSSVATEREQPFNSWGLRALPPSPWGPHPSSKSGHVEGCPSPQSPFRCTLVPRAPG